MAYNDLSIRDKAQVIRMGVRAGLKSLKDIQSFYDSTAQHVDTEPLDEFAEGGSIHIKHPGRLTALKKRTGKSEAELWATGNAHTRKMITFARNARKWKHDLGGELFGDGGSIHIAPSKKGTFTAAATKHGKSVQAFASQVLANKENYSPAMVKKAVFAHNSKSWKHADGGYLVGKIYDVDEQEYNRLINAGYEIEVL